LPASNTAAQSAKVAAVNRLTSKSVHSLLSAYHMHVSHCLFIAQ